MANWFVSGTATGSGAGSQASPWTLAQLSSNASVLSGDTVYFQGTVLASSSCSLPVGVQLVGYSITPGDGGFATLEWGSSQATAAPILSLGAGSYKFYNLIFDGTGAGSGWMLNTTNDDAIVEELYNCEFVNWAVSPFWHWPGHHPAPSARKCYFSGCFPFNFANTLDGCVFNGIAFSGDSIVASYATFCIFVSCTHPLGADSGVAAEVRNCTFVKCNPSLHPFHGGLMVLSSCLFYANATTDAVSDGSDVWYYNCAFGNYSSYPGGDGITPSTSVGLAANPFVNPTATINSVADAFAAFALNSTSGGGAACKGAGDPANLDIGAVQSAASGGGSGGVAPWEGAL